MTRPDRLKHFFLALAFIAVCACHSQIAHAATGTGAITLTRPLVYADGSTLPASAITGYRVICEFTGPGATNATPCTFTGSPLPGGTATGGNVTLTYPASGGEACFFLLTVAGSIESLPSPKACKTLAPIAPNPPSNVTVTITLALNLTSESPIRVVVAEPVVTRGTP